MARTEQSIRPDQRPAQLRIASAIRTLMAAKGEDQADLAALLHMDQPGVSKMLRGVRKMTVDELAIVCDHYDVGAGILLEGAESVIRTGSCAPTFTVIDGGGMDHDDTNSPEPQGSGGAIRPILTIVP